MHVRGGRSLLVRVLFASGVVLGLTSSACRQTQATSPQRPPVMYTPSAPYSPYATGPQVAPPASPPAARGWACASDADLACAYSHCIGGACGGCASDAECKANAACAWTLLGNACMPRFGGSAPPSGPPAPPPAHPPPQVQPAPPVPPAPQASDPYAAARKQCVDQINAYRAQTGVGQLVQRTDMQTCADADARGDSATGQAHGGAGKCGWGSQNECPGWPGSETDVVRGCTQMMYREGPGEPYSEHGHYLNMTARHNKGVACGFHRAADGKLWVVQNFY